MCGESDDWNVAGLRIALESPRGFPAVDDGHFEVHQDDVRLLGSRHLAPFLAVLRPSQNLQSQKRRTSITSCAMSPHPCPSRKLYPRVAMMQSGQDWCGDDGPRSLYGSS